MTKTEELEMEIDGLFVALGNANALLSNSIVRDALTVTILKACKEAGLWFIPDYTITYTPPMQAANFVQPEPIEVE